MFKSDHFNQIAHKAADLDVKWQIQKGYFEITDLNLRSDTEWRSEKSC